MSFTDEQVESAWQRGAIVLRNDANVYRKDQCGAWIKKSAYGDRDHKYGWEIGHILAKSNGGTDVPSNLRPLHWKNNLKKSDGKLSCAVTAYGIENILR